MMRTCHVLLEHAATHWSNRCSKGPGLEGALHFAGLQAASADVRAHGSAVLENAQLLEVRIEATLRGDHGMTAVITEGRSSAAGAADARHGDSMLDRRRCRKQHPSPKMSSSSHYTLLELALGARARLAAESERINAINVFPVADGDTGSNLLHTIDAVVDCLRSDPTEPARAVGDAALLGARGNSGTILASMIRAAAGELGAGQAVPGALMSGVRAAYRAVPEPVEGTMLTVAQASADAASGETLEECVTTALAGARAALAQTPAQLEQLRAAGVVDAGAAGLVALLEGLVGVLAGEPVVDHSPAAVRPAVHVADPSSRYHYCIGFVMRSVDLAGLRVTADSWGDSLVLAGDAELLRVHVHADDVERVTTEAGAFGEVSDCVTSDMRGGIAVRGPRRALKGTTAIVYDSTADLPIAEHPDWTMVPLTVHFGDVEFRDYVDLAVAEFYERLASSSTHPTTSQPAPGAFIVVYGDLLERYEHVVSIHISAGLSGTYGSACTAAQEFPGRVTVIDSRLVSMPLALGLGCAQAALDAGVSPSDLPALFEKIARESGCLFSVATLEYLQRGGRIGRAQALVGTLLGVHPLLAVEAGEVVPVGRVRGEARVLPELVAEFVRRSASFSTIDVAIAHADDPERAAGLEALVWAARTGIRSMRILTLGAVVGTHAGPGALGLAFVAAD